MGTPCIIVGAILQITYTISIFLQTIYSKVWIECKVEGDQMQISDRRGLKIIPDGWYRYKTWPDQPFPWIITDRIRLLRPPLQNEVKAIALPMA